MDKSLITKYLIYAGCILFVFMVNFVYFKSANKIIEKTFVSKINNSAINNDINLQKPTLILKEISTIDANTALTTDQNSLDTSNLIKTDDINVNENLNLIAQATTQMTGIEVLNEDEKLLANKKEIVSSENALELKSHHSKHSKYF